MMLAPIWRTRLFGLGGAAVGMVLAVFVAQESYFWPSLVAGLMATSIIIYVSPQPVTTVLLGVALFGYIVGNRGFAQFSLAGNFPLLPAEFVLLVGVPILLAQSAWRKTLPFRADALNYGIVLWILAGTLRLFFGVREHGFAAIRDYALVYYASYFFLAQEAARDGARARFLRGSILVACACLVVVYPLFLQFPNFFTFWLTVRGVPIIFVKGDLAGNFLALGALVAYATYERTRHMRWLIFSLVCAAVMITTDSRSSIVGLGAGALWFAFAGRWRLMGMLAGGAVFAAVALLIVAEVQNISWRQTPLFRVYERVLSISDPFGQRTYQSEDAFKGDNNIFRMVWWRAAIDETIETNPWFGLGFGHDLATRFVREYYPEGGEEFTARSPHNVLITIFARMGVMGLLGFLAVMAAMAVRTWRAMRSSERVFVSGAYWAGAWALLVCACFGVMLEGPMGAVVFWTVLGMANAMDAPPALPDSAHSTDETAEPAQPQLARV